MTSSVLARPAVAPVAELRFGTADFERVRRLIHARAGIHLQPGKQAMVYSRLGRRVRELGHGAFADYLDRLERLERDGGEAAEREWQQFVNCLTTNLTSFFREAHHFPVLAEALLERRGDPVRIWCNAASTGEEPYSLAITVLQTLGDGTAASVLATDIDTGVLETARRGVYGADARGLDDALRRRFFLRGVGANAGSMRVRPELQRLVEFRPFNLVAEPWSLQGPFDIVFCRNVMIYFDPSTQRRVLEGMHRVLRPQGLLFAGHSENFTASRDLFRLRGQTVYERV